MGVEVAILTDRESLEKIVAGQEAICTSFVNRAFDRIERKIDILSHRISAADGEI
jgi:hypothetical protein